jgi:protein-tyrosine kinase
MSARPKSHPEAELGPKSDTSRSRLASVEAVRSRRGADDFEETRLIDDPRERQIGDLLREVQVLTEEQTQHVLDYQREHSVRFGVAAIRLGYSTEKDVLFALARQFKYPYAVKGDENMDAELVVGTDPFGEQAEAFRELRSQLLQGVMEQGADGRRPALAVVSTSEGDGKSFFAANLAVAFAQLGGRTVLIDADMRTPRQHELFKIDSSSGLSTVLAGRTKQQTVHRTAGIPSLYVMPVGVVPPNPLELVQGMGFSLMLHEMTEKFDYVIVDTPASCQGSDARVIAAKCGAALAIARRNKSRMDELRDLTKRLVRTNVKLGGIAVNEY